MKKCKLAIVGATGLVGQKVIKVLWEEGLLEQLELVLIASEKNAGRRYFFKGQEYNIVSLSDKCLNFGLDVVIFSAGEDVSKKWAEKFVKAGAVVIDNTNAFRKQSDVPLVVPEINSDEISIESKIISNPNCSTIQLAVVLDKLKNLSKINKVVVSTYQSVSGAGKLALIDYQNNSKFYFLKGINGNIIPQIGELSENGFSLEENKIIFELNKILKTNINIIATAVRVPVPYCHGESVYVEFEKDVCVDDAVKELSSEYIKVVSDDICFPIDCTDTNDTYVCRVRQYSKRELVFFVVADNLRRGAAFNAVKIAEMVLNKINSGS